METTNYLIVANLSQLQASCGVRPYQIWLKMGESSQPVYDFAQERGIRFSVFRDTSADLIALKNEPVFQGTNGVLTADFIIVLLLCMVGFLIYWILSIRSRELQFGIFRAMGLSMQEIITTVSYTHLDVYKRQVPEQRVQCQKRAPQLFPEAQVRLKFSVQDSLNNPLVLKHP